MWNIHYNHCSDGIIKGYTKTGRHIQTYQDMTARSQQ